MESKLFDPNRDPASDMNQALAYAKANQKNILVEIGGDWCKWCHILENFITQHRELSEIRYKNYVHVKIYLGENDSINHEFLRKFPYFDGIPHFFVLDFDGNLLHSQDTDVLEEGESYNYDRVFSFLAQWGYKTPFNEIM
jgi:thiol:disulfide interchange protein